MRYISVMGDSISTFEGTNPDGYAVFYEGERCAETGVRTVADTWWMQVIDALGGTLLANAAWSGSMVEGAGFPAGNSDERVAALGRDGHAPDDVLVYYGTNDYGWGSAEAQAAGRASSVPFCLVREGRLPELAEPGLAPTDAAEAFGTAYAQMLARIRTAYPDARVWCLTLAPGRVRGLEQSTFPRAYRGATWKAYNDAICHAAAKNGCSICDIAALGYDYEGIEGTHPTALGMRQLAWMTLACLQAAGENVNVGDYPGGALFTATDPCDEPGKPCVGCPHALATGARWMHVCQRRM